MVQERRKYVHTIHGLRGVLGSVLRLRIFCFSKISAAAAENKWRLVYSSHTLADLTTYTYGKTDLEVDTHTYVHLADGNPCRYGHYRNVQIGIFQFFPLGIGDLASLNHFETAL